LALSAVGGKYSKKKANLYYGIEVNTAHGAVKPCKTVAELDGALKRAGVSGGLVRTIAADVSGVVTGNGFLKDDLAKTESDLYGMYTIIPSSTHEIPEPADLGEVMKKGKFAALRINPRQHKFIAKAGVIADYLDMAQARKIPVMLDTACGLILEEIWDMLEVFPKLTAILAYQNIWPADRFYRPFLDKFPNLRMELSSMITDQGIEDLVKNYGSGRLLFGSRFPEMYIGGVMMQLKHADISESDREKIAGGNFLALLKEAQL